MKPKYTPVAFLIIVAMANAAHGQKLGVEQDITQAPPSGVPPVSRAADKLPDKSTLVGLDVFSQNQNRVGSVEKVVPAGDGTVAAIHIRTGGFLGFGGRLVSISPERFSMRGPTIVQLQLTADEVARLPALQDPS